MQNMKKVLAFVWLFFVGLAFVVGWWQKNTQTRPSPSKPAANKPVLQVAVAANFLATARQLAQAFKEKTGLNTALSPGSTGALFAQIHNGRPYDIFLAADSQRPEQLVATGLADASSAFVYATGRLMLWVPQFSPQRNKNCQNALENGLFQRLVIANPKTAPYGRASKEVLQHYPQAVSASQQITMGDISQVLQVLDSGNADAGFIARSQWQLLPKKHRRGCTWSVPPSLHTPIQQKAVILKNSHHPEAARKFLAFMRSQRGQDIIRRTGYTVE